MRPIHIIGVPLDLGGGRRGVDMGPSAFRIAGLRERVTNLGYEVVDRGDLPAPIPETQEQRDERKKYIDDIARVCQRLYETSVKSLEAGAIPLTTAAVISYDRHGKKMEGFWVRDKTKEHGTRKLVEGNLQPGSRVVIVDDVITKGGSSLKAIKAVKEMQCEVVLVLALVDRLQGAEELFRAEGIGNYQSVFTIRDFGVEVHGGAPVQTASY